MYLSGFGVFVGYCNRVMEGTGKEVEVRDQNDGFTEESKDGGVYIHEKWLRNEGLI